MVLFLSLLVSSLLLCLRRFGFCRKVVNPERCGLLSSEAVLYNWYVPCKVFGKAVDDDSVATFP